MFITIVFNFFNFFNFLNFRIVEYMCNLNNE